MLDYFRIATVSPKLKVGDVRFNVDTHIKCIIDILREDPDVSLIVFPELSLTGYTCGDLFLTDDLLDSVLSGIEVLKSFSCNRNNIPIICGAPIKDSSKIYNSALFIFGNSVQRIDKVNLPNYQEFYERRWFSEGISETKIFQFGDIRVGIELCEDLWVPNPPCEKLVTEGGADIIINLSASPRLAGKYKYLSDLVKITSGRLCCSYVYVSSGPWESSTDLVFSGWSMVYENAKLLKELPPIKSLNEESRYLITDIDVQETRSYRRKTKMKVGNCDPVCLSEPRPITNLSPYRSYNPYPFLEESNFEEVFTIQSLGLQKRIMSCGGSKCKVIIGISGGTDSTLALLVALDSMDRLGFSRENIIGVTMPCFGTTSRTLQNSRLLMKLSGITYKEIDITSSVTEELKALGHPLDLYDIAFENVQARMRTQILFNLSNMEGGIVLGTGDLSELALGWCTFGGDHLLSYNPNVSIPKTLVKKLIEWKMKGESDKKFSKVLEDILQTTISPELLPPDSSGNIVQSSEDSIGPYELHDYFLYHFLRTGREEGYIIISCIAAFKGKYSSSEIRKYFAIFKRRFKTQQFKRSCLPDGPKTGYVSLSPRGDWRMPSDL